MAKIHATLRELCFLGAFVLVLALFVYPLLAGVGAIGWGLLGEWFVRYDDQYDWIDGCLKVGRYFGAACVVAGTLCWARGRAAYYRGLQAKYEHAAGSPSTPPPPSPNSVKTRV